jgi:hypothetical protein
MTFESGKERLQTLINRYKTEIESRHGKSIGQLREEREKRVDDVLNLRTPDRVPTTMQAGVFACRYTGTPLSSMYYDPIAYAEACLKTIVDFEPDITGSLASGNSGLVNELLDVRSQRWPGGNLPPDVPYQFVEGEYMKPEEYDLFLADPSDYIIRYHLPRLYGMFEPLAQLPPFHNLVGGGAFGLLAVLGKPEYRQLAEKLSRTIQEQEKSRREAAELNRFMDPLGYSSMLNRGARSGGIMGAPFDAVSDFFRGMKGAMLDMYRCPDKLLATCDKILEWRIAEAKPAKPDSKGHAPRMFMPLHRGSDGFMSIKQFEKFYWPGLKKAIMTNIELGYIVEPFFEGSWDSRLEYLLELPKGKVVFFTEKTNIFKAKEVLGKHMCIQGGVPPSLLSAGSPREVEDHCKKLIQVVGKDGGFILSCGSAIDEAKPENLKAMVDSARKYHY